MGDAPGVDSEKAPDAVDGNVISGSCGEKSLCGEVVEGVEEFFVADGVEFAGHIVEQKDGFYSGFFSEAGDFCHFDGQTDGALLSLGCEHPCGASIEADGPVVAVRSDADLLGGQFLRARRLVVMGIDLNDILEACAILGAKLDVVAKRSAFVRDLAVDGVVKDLGKDLGHIRRKKLEVTVTRRDEFQGDREDLRIVYVKEVLIRGFGAKKGGFLFADFLVLFEVEEVGRSEVKHHAVEGCPAFGRRVLKDSDIRRGEQNGSKDSKVIAHARTRHSVDIDASRFWREFQTQACACRFILNDGGELRFFVIELYEIFRSRSAKSLQKSQGVERFQEIAFALGIGAIKDVKSRVELQMCVRNIAEGEQIKCFDMHGGVILIRFGLGFYRHARCDTGSVHVDGGGKFLADVVWGSRLFFGEVRLRIRLMHLDTESVFEIAQRGIEGGIIPFNGERDSRLRLG